MSGDLIPAAAFQSDDMPNEDELEEALLWAARRRGDLYPIDRVLYDVDRMCHDTIPLMAVKLSPDVDAMALLLQDVRRAIAQLRWADETLEDEIVKAMPTKDMDVAGVGRIELRTGTKRTAWDKDGLVGVLTARIADDPTIVCEPETGELLSPHEQVERILGRFMEAATPSWKVTGLRAFKVDPDEYATTTYGRKTVQMPKVDPWPDTEPKEEAE